MKKLRNNGYIIQRKKSSIYYGVDGDNWYLNYCSNKIYFKDFYDKNIDKAWQDFNCVDCCSDIEYIKYYVRESLELGIEFNVLLCATIKSEPCLVKEYLDGEENFLGYDYAYSGGSYYSAILNDIISGRIKEFREIRLNENGLFDSYDEVNSFILLRDKIKKQKNYVLEDGDFIIYKITQLRI